MPNPKHIAALIVSKAAPVKDSEEQTQNGQEMMEGAAQEVMDALKADDVKAFCEALQSFIQICIP